MMCQASGLTSVCIDSQTTLEVRIALLALQMRGLGWKGKETYPEFEGNGLTYIKAVCLRLYLNQQMAFLFIMLNDHCSWEEGKSFPVGLQLLA